MKAMFEYDPVKRITVRRRMVWAPSMQRAGPGTACVERLP